MNNPIRICGAYAEAVVFADELEPSALGQIKKLCEMESSAESTIRVMPDVHAGAGSVIGLTMTISNKVIPNLVGVDIGCGMETVLLEQKRIDLPKFDSLIQNIVPAGMEVRGRAHKYANQVPLEELRCLSYVNPERGLLSIGTLGGGNHFIELDKDEEDNLYLVVHSGSRNIGLQVAQYYQEAGFRELKEASDIAEENRREAGGIPYELAYLTGALLDDYLHDMAIMQQYAGINRKAITDEILSGMKLREVDRFTTIHNYIDTGEMMIRKGSVSAKQGERILIPLNMRDGSLICTGLGNPDWNCSAPHGAGRLMSRNDAKRSFTLSDFKKEMAGVYTSSVNAGTLDECPMAYKTPDSVVHWISQTAEIDKIIKPIYNFKAGETVVRRRKS